jgi:hypothetical protein
MCVTCGTSNCDCSKATEIKYTSQIIYDGEKKVLVTAGITIEKCDSLNDIISKFADKIEELS